MTRDPRDPAYARSRATLTASAAERGAPPRLDVMPIAEGTLDASVDAAYLPVESATAGRSTENIVIERDGGTIILDMDAEGRLLGIEILGASRLLSATALAGLHRIG